MSNRVICPNVECNNTFCWLCLSKATESEDKERDHFASRNYRGCPDYEFLDVRNDPADGSSIDECCLKLKRVSFMLTMPWLNIYGSVRNFSV